MRVPDRLEPLLDQGVIEAVVRPLMSGKEAEVYLVRCDGDDCVAKVYKNAQFRSFQQRAEYTEGRRVRSTREQRAMDRGSRHGRRATEEAWRSAEADTIYLLRAAGVRVPEPIAFVEGVLVMELVKDEAGEPAPRLVDRRFDTEEATEVFHLLLREVVKMLCAGIVHADLSDFNVLMGVGGPVLIDFPQAVDPARNLNARRLLLRDLKNLTSFLGRFAPKLRSTQYGPEMWDLYERSELRPDTPLTGRFRSRAKQADVSSLLDEMLEMEREHRERREALGLPPPRPARRPIEREQPEAQGSRPSRSRRRGKAARPPGAGEGAPAKPSPDAAPGDAPKKRRHRRRRKRPADGDGAQRPGGGAPAGAAGGPNKGAGENAPAGERPKPPRRRRRRRRGRGGDR